MHPRFPLVVFLVAAGCEAGPIKVIRSTAGTPDTDSLGTVSVDLLHPASIAVACVSRTDPSEVHLLERDGTRSVDFRFAGLLPSTDYDCTVASTALAAPTAKTTFRTMDPPADLASADVVTDPGFDPTPGYTVMTVRPECHADQQDYVAVLDADGNLRYHYDLPENLNIGVEATVDGPNRILWGGGDDVSGAASVVDVVDGPQWRLQFPGSDDLVFHHDVHRLPDGRILSVELTEDQGWQAFQLRLADESGDASWLWNVQTAVDSGFLPSGSPTNRDPHHLNWADVVDSGDGPIAYGSLCYSQLVVAIDVTTGKPLWKFGAGGDFALVDPKGNPLPADDFPQCQHGLQMDGKHLLVYDNGLQRGVTRSVEYELDVDRMVATQTWEWLDGGYYEPYHGGMDWLTPDHDRVLVAEPSNDCGQTSDRHSQVVEVDRPTDTVVQRMTLRDIGSWLYRAHRVDGCSLFANARYCPDVADRVDELRTVLGI